ncbi:MAG: hypothetical protein AB8G86_12590 [Saprospiraceae bacterium]
MFTKFKKSIQSKLDYLIKNSVALYEVNIDKTELWNLYLEAFPEGTNLIYKERREYDCSCCGQFVKNYGLIVGIINGKTVSIWDVDTIEPFQTVANKLNEKIAALPITNVFYSKFAALGTDYNFELVDNNNKKWNHFYYKLPGSLVNKNSESIDALKGDIRQTKDVIKRSFEELNPSSIDTVLELIKGKSLYRGEEHKSLLTTFKNLQLEWIKSKHKAHFCWEAAVIHGRLGAIRNTAIGTLLVNLSNLMDLETAVKKYEAVVAPQNYKRPKPIFTTIMRKAAEQKVLELGLMESLERRHATMRNLSMQDVLWASGESKKVMKNAFNLLDGAEKTTISTYENIEEVGIDFFLKNILPTAEKMELLLDNSYQNNLVSLIAPVHADKPRLFKWENGFSWTYNGNFTDSIKEAVKSRGGKVDGVLRFSLSWAEGDALDNSDLDAHCRLPGAHISYSNKKDNKSWGQLDVDIQLPKEQLNKDIVENITWPNKKRMPIGDYVFSVVNYSLRGIQNGFTSEIEFGGQIYTFHYDKPMRQKEEVQVATVRFDGENFKIIKSIPSNLASKELWGMKTMKFIPITALLKSPNHWGANSIGNKHYFFTLENCLNPDMPRGFYNEFLRQDIYEHRKVFEALGNKMKIEFSEDQLSGVGFSSTMNQSIILKINSKPLKLKFTNEELIFNSSKEKVQISNF